jgi:hypothetical protein
MAQFEKLIKIYFSPYTGTKYTVGSGYCPSFSCATSSSLLTLTVGPQQEKAFCVLRFEVSRSMIRVQREFRTRFKKDAPHKNDIARWYRQFVETGSLYQGRSPKRPRVLKTILRECVRRFSEVPASQWQEQARNRTCQK